MQTAAACGAGGERIIWVDIARGICILLMVAGHTLSPFGTLIYLFHIPAFFILSGFTCAGERLGLGRYAWEKAKRLMLPFFAVNLFFVLLAAAASALGLSGLFMAQREPGLAARLAALFSLYPGTPQLGGATWFLPVLFLAEILYRVFGFVCAKLPFLRQREWLLAFAAGLAGQWLSAAGLWLPYNADLALTGCMYLGLGAALRRYRVMEERIPPRPMLASSIGVVMFLAFFFYRAQGPMNWPTRVFNPLPIQLPAVFCSFYLLAALGRWLAARGRAGAFFAFYGRHSFAVLAFHFAAFRLFSLVLVGLRLQDQAVLQELVPPPMEGLWWLAYAAFAAGFCLLISRLAGGFAPADFLVNARLARRGKKERA